MTTYAYLMADTIRTEMDDFTLPQVTLADVLDIMDHFADVIEETWTRKDHMHWDKYRTTTVKFSDGSRLRLVFTGYNVLSGYKL